MKKVSVKGLMIVTLFLASMFMMPLTVFAQEDEEVQEEGNVGIYQSFTGGFGAAFSGYGYGGQLMGAVFEMLLLQGLDLENTELTEGVFVLSASKEETFSGNKTFSTEDEELHILPDVYSELVNPGDPDDMIYVEVDKSGGFDYNLTVGASITLLIWDYDGSFITAAQKVIDATSKLAEETKGGGEPSEETLNEVISVVSWLVIHINDIFTGDELFVLNPITYQNLVIEPWKVAEGDSADMDIVKNAYWSNDRQIGGDTPLETALPGASTEINTTAKAYKDSATQWLFTNIDPSDLVETMWTQFSFDIAQLWVKNFHVEIDVAELTKGADANFAKAFSGLDIEFFLFTHHLGGSFLYNDTIIPDNKISVNYTRVLNETDPGTEEDPNYIKDPQGNDIYVPVQNEVTHQNILGNVTNFKFNKPKVEDDGDVAWGITLEKATMRPVPVGIDLNNYLGTPDEKLDFIEFGLVFQKDVAEEANEDGTYDASGWVKLEHNFAPWNGGTGPINDIAGLDLAIVYISSIFHFHLNVENEAEEVDPEEDDYVNDNGWDNENKTLQVGNYLDPDSKDKLNFVDLAGDPYQISLDSDEDGNPDDTTEYTPTTTIVPVALWSATGEKHQTYEGDEEKETDDFTTDVSLEVSFNVLLYAVCYPEFGNNPGYGIWHDPTFSVYMVFTPDTMGFWALILLIAGVGLLGVATILIKRRKDRMY